MKKFFKWLSVASAILISILSITFFVYISATFGRVEEIAFGRGGRQYWDYNPSLQHKSVLPQSELYAVVYTFKLEGDQMHWIRTDIARFNPELSYETILELGGDSPYSVQPGSDHAQEMDALMVRLKDELHNQSWFDRVPNWER